MPRVKRLVKHGNSQALILDKSLMDVAGIEPNSLVAIDIKDNRLVIGPAEPATEEEHMAKVKASMAKGNRQHGRVFENLAHEPGTDE